MVSKKVQESREQLYVIGSIVSLIVMIVLVLLNIYLFYSLGSINKNLAEYSQDKQFLTEQNDMCWKQLRKYDPNCWDTNDCSKYPNLTGCHKAADGCNQCCFNVCTLMNCQGLKNWTYTYYQENKTPTPILTKSPTIYTANCVYNKSGCKEVLY